MPQRCLARLSTVLLTDLEHLHNLSSLSTEAGFAQVVEVKGGVLNMIFFFCLDRSCNFYFVPEVILKLEILQMKV